MTLARDVDGQRAGAGQLTEGEMLMAVSICGTVKDVQGRPLSGVKLVAVHEPTGSLFAKITGEDGRFLFENIKVGGPYALRASKEGLVDVENRLKLRTEEELEHDITMHTPSESSVNDESHTSA